MASAAPATSAAAVSVLCGVAARAAPLSSRSSDDGDELVLFARTPREHPSSVPTAGLTVAKKPVQFVKGPAHFLGNGQTFSFRYCRDADHREDCRLRDRCAFVHPKTPRDEVAAEAAHRAMCAGKPCQYFESCYNMFCAYKHAPGHRVCPNGGRCPDAFDANSGVYRPRCGVGLHPPACRNHDRCKDFDPNAEKATECKFSHPRSRSAAILPTQWR